MRTGPVKVSNNVLPRKLVLAVHRKVTRRDVFTPGSPNDLESEASMNEYEIGRDMGKLMATVEALSKELEAYKGEHREKRTLTMRVPISKGTAGIGRSAYRGALLRAKAADAQVFNTWTWTGGSRTNGANLYFGTSTLTVFTNAEYTFTQDYHQHYVWPGGTYSSITVQITLRSNDGAAFLLESFQNLDLETESDVSASWSAGPFWPPPTGLVDELSNVFDNAFPPLFVFQIS
jgi:hypothetical protein